MLRSSLPRRRPARVAGVAIVAGLSLLLTACGGDSDDGDATTEPSGAANEEAAALLPDDIREAGVVKVAATINYPPEQFYEDDGKTATGFSVELGEALGKQLGVTFEFENVSFDAILPGITAGRYDVAISSMSITPERAQQVNFVKYFDAGATLLVSGANPKGINGLDDLCGMTVANNKGSANGDFIAKHSDEYCVPNGLPEIQLDELAGESPYQAVDTGRADAAFRDFTANAYAAQQSDGKLQVVGDLVKTKPYGIAVGKDATDLAEAITAAMNAIIKDGSYLDILSTWDVEGGAVPEAELVTSAG